MSQIGSTAAGGGGGAVNSVTGGTGINTSGTAADPVVNLDVPIIISHGGTNAITMATTYGVNYFDGTSIVTTAVGNAGEVLTSGGIGVAPTFQAGGSTIDITGDSGGALTGTSFTFTGGTTGITFAGAGTTETLTGTLVVANGGTGATALTQYNVLIGNNVSAITTVAPSATSGVPLISQGAAADPAFGTAVVAGGGSGRTTATAYAVICGGTTTTAAHQSIASVGTSGQLLTSNGAGALPTFQTAGSASISITGDSGGALVASAFTFTGGTTGLTFAGAGTTETITGTLVVANGGTGLTSFTQGDIIYSSAANTLSALAKNASSTRYLSNTGASNNPAWAQIALATGVSGTLPVANGGTSSTSLTQYNVLIGNNTSAIATVAPSATSGVPLISQGAAVNPAFGTAVVAGGGSGRTTATAYAVICGGTTTTAAHQSIASVGTSGQILTSNGAGALPTFQAAGGGGGGLTWAVTTVNATLVVANGYIANKAGLLTMTLPSTAAIGDIIELTNINTAVGWRIAQNALQAIRFGSSLTTIGVGGYLEATALGDSVRMVCTVSGTSTRWLILSSLGNITIV